MNISLLLSFAALLECPFFSEILPDPSVIEDSRGEFVEIALPSQVNSEDSLSLFFGEKLFWHGIVPSGMSRMLLIRDTSLCPQKDSLFCGLLTSGALPNFKTAGLKLLFGSCVDSVHLELPKSGKSFHRRELYPDVWTIGFPSPGYSNQYEPGVHDCPFKVDSLEFVDGYWFFIFEQNACDSLKLDLSFESLYSTMGNSESEITLIRNKPLKFNTRLTADAISLRAIAEKDDYPDNDTLDTLGFLPSFFPVYISEVHPCPEEGIPEWIELYNSGSTSISLKDLNFYGISFISSLSRDSLTKGESLIVTKDTADFRKWLGLYEVHLNKVDFGYLNNISDTIRLYYRNILVDSVFWGKNMRIEPHCPNGFSPRTGKKENSPGFQTTTDSLIDTTSVFEIKWNSRVFSKKQKTKSLMISARTSVTLDVKLFSRDGQLLWSGFFPPDQGGNYWKEIPILSKGSLGPNFIRITDGHHEKRFGVVLRP